MCHDSTRRSPQTPPPRRAFALHELLVAAACLVLLVTMIAPSLEVARQKTRDSTCRDRLRAIGQASVQYAIDDPVGWAIPIHPKQFEQNPLNPLFIGAYEWGGKSGIGGPNILEFGPESYGGRFGTRTGFGPATRPLNRYLYPHGFRDYGPPNLDRRTIFQDTMLQLDAFRCPADDGPPAAAHCPAWIENPTRSSFDHFGNSYAANTFMIVAQGGGPMLSNSPYLRPISRIATPARTLNYEENIGRWAWAARREQCDFLGPGVDPGPTKSIRGWHGKDWTYNRAFVDGHVRTQSVYVEGTEDRDEYAEHYFNEYLSHYPPFPDCTACKPGADDCPGSEGSFQNYRCIIVRGPGWQKDTLPAPLICTGLTSPGGGRASYEDCVTGE